MVIKQVDTSIIPQSATKTKKAALKLVNAAFFLTIS